MSSGTTAFQALLDNMRREFVDGLPERCDSLEEWILALEAAPDSRETFNELYRGVHSLKGAGGTHGLSIVTTLCHQLENALTEAESQQNFGSIFASGALAYVDLLRQIVVQARCDRPDYSGIEDALETLHRSGLQSRKAGLIAEPSSAMAGFYQQALTVLPVQLTVVDNGLTALERLLHESFDFVIVGRELKELNGIALIAALRASQGRNHRIPALLLTSRGNSLPDQAHFNAVIARDQKQAENLVAAVRQVLALR